MFPFTNNNLNRIPFCVINPFLNKLLLFQNEIQIFRFLHNFIFKNLSFCFSFIFKKVFINIKLFKSTLMIRLIWIRKWLSCRYLLYQPIFIKRTHIKKFRKTHFLLTFTPFLRQLIQDFIKSFASVFKKFLFLLFH